VKLDIEAPRYNPRLPLGTMFSSSGWPIIIRADASARCARNRNQRVAARVSRPNARRAMSCSPIPTGAWSCRPHSTALERHAPGWRRTRPTWSSPTTSTRPDFPTTPAIRGVASRLAVPADSGRPVFHAVGDLNGDFVLDPVDVEVGPSTGESVDDGFGYGADDDFPGLVLLTPVG
jgi:hypothetical protein